jgi:tetratricopeptide (TPR) repeat protein
MEFADAGTVRSWLKDGDRTIHEILDVFLAAGSGLVAAHAAGLVHRDFKPDNVVVGTDGRVRVLDFGLARLRQGETTTPASRDSDLAIETRSPLTDQLTEAGTVMGTPAYMAPEIHDGLGADARSDQFAFGVALFEALYRIRPYDKADLVPPRSSPTPKSTPDIGLPARLARTVTRSIAIDPAARFPTMDALLAELALDPNRNRRRVAIGAAFGVLGLGVIGSIVLATRSPPVALCTGTERALAGVWDPPVKHEIHSGFAATKKPWAEASYNGLARALDGYAKDWTEATVGNCEATRIRGEQTEKVFAARQLCLDQRLEELRVLAKLLQQPSDALVEKADKAAFELEPVAACANTASLISPDVIPVEHRKKYLELLFTLASARASMIAGQYVAGLASAQHAIDEGNAIHADDVVAAALMTRGTVLQLAGNQKEGDAELAEATWVALRARLEVLASRSALANAMAQAEHADSLPTARLWLDLATATASKPNVDPLFEMQMLETRGAIEAQQGELTAAIATHQKGLEAALALYGANSPELWGPENQIATTMGRAGAWVAAMPHLEHALALREAAVGPDHPDVGLLMSNLGACYDHAGEDKKALAAFKRALALRERSYGPNSPFIVGTLNNMSDFEMRHGEPGPALADVERAKAIALRIPGTASPLYHVVATTYAEVLGRTGKVAAARAAFDEVIALEQGVKSPELGTTLTARGALELAAHQWVDAVSFEQRAIADYEATGGAEHLSLWKPLAGLATARRALDPKANVKPLLERAVAIGKTAQISADDMNPIRDALANM